MAFEQTNLAALKAILRSYGVDDAANSHEVLVEKILEAESAARETDVLQDSPDAGAAKEVPEICHATSIAYTARVAELMRMKPAALKEILRSYGAEDDSSSREALVEKIMETEAATQSADVLHGLPDGWESAVDPASGFDYYYNHDLGRSQWERPTKATPRTTTTVAALSA